MATDTLSPVWVYGINGSDLILIPARTALERALGYFALREATTWGDLVNRVSPARLAQVVGNLYDEVPPGDAAVLTQQDKDAIEGEWIEEWPQAEMLDWLPSDLIDKLKLLQLVSSGFSASGGECLCIPEVNEEVLVKVLQSAGFTCTRNQELVDWAHGDLK